MQTRERAHCARSVFPFIKKKKKKCQRFFQAIFQPNIAMFNLFYCIIIFARRSCFHRRLYPLVPYPYTYIALYFSYAKVTCNTHKNKKLLSIPLKLVPLLAKLPLPYFPPSTGRSAFYTQSSHSIFWRRAVRLLCTALSLLSFVAEMFMVSRLPVFFMALFHRVFM